MKKGDQVRVLLYGRAKHWRGGWKPFHEIGTIAKVNRKTVDVEIRPDWIMRVKVERVELIGEI